MNMLSFATEWTLAYCGFTALSLGMDRHHADIHGRGSVPGKQQRIRLQASGSLALMASYFISSQAEGWAMGTLSCLGTMTAAALPLALLLTYAPQKTAILGKLAGRSEEHTSELQSLMRISYAVFCLKQKK